MSIRVQQVEGRKVSPEQVEQEEAKRRSPLGDTAILFERVSSVSLQDGTRIDLPSLSASDSRALRTFYGALSQGQQGELRTLSGNLAQNLREQAQGGDPAAANAAATANLVNITEMVARVNAAQGDDEKMQMVLLNSTAGIYERMTSLAQNVKFKVDTQRELRTDIAELRNLISEWPEGVEKQTITYHKTTVDDAGNVKVEEVTESVTKAEATSRMEGLEGQLQSVSELTELQRLDLQDVVQKESQIFQMLSSLFKNQHETLRGIIQNLRA